MQIKATITGYIKYVPCLCGELKTYFINDLTSVLPRRSVFVLDTGDNQQFAVSWWVSPKRTRSYPFARIYDSLGFQGKRITIIPVWKDEGKDGDNDYIQWDSISLMSLLNIYVIIAYYARAQRNPKFKNKITKQQFEAEYVIDKIKELSSCHSSALHWNMEQLAKIGVVADKALSSYRNISSTLGVEMHSSESISKRITLLQGDLSDFMEVSRKGAESAQGRELVTTQPKENVAGNKSTITIKNFLGGFYYLTADEAEIIGNDLYICECKHNEHNKLPSWNDIKDGLLKMMLFSNLQGVKVDNKEYNPVAVLKLTSKKGFNVNNVSAKQKDRLLLLKRESELNNFTIRM